MRGDRDQRYERHAQPRRRADDPPLGPSLHEQYRHPGYGRLRVRVHREGLRLCHVGWPYERMEYRLTARANGAFRLVGPPGADLGRADVRFRSGRQGRITSLCIPFEPLVESIRFRRVPPAN